MYIYTYTCTYENMVSSSLPMQVQEVYIKYGYLATFQQPTWIQLNLQHKSAPQPLVCIVFFLFFINLQPLKTF